MSTHHIVPSPNRGRVFILPSLYTLELLKDLQLLPIKIEYHILENRYEIIGTSPYFNVVKEGETIPVYDIIIDPDKARIVSSGHRY